MKKIYFSILTSAAILSAGAQTLTQANHAPTNGDTYSTKQCDSLNINPGAAGANVTWSFATLNIHNSVVANYTTQASVVSSYPAGSQVTASSPNDLAYTQSSATDLKYYGGNFKVQTNDGSLTYTAGAIYGVYPMNLNTTGTSAIGGSISVVNPTSLSGTFIGNSMTIADGSGTLILPGGVQGTYTNVLRVVNSQTLNFSSGFINGTILLKDYKYYSPGIKAPLLTISTKTISTPLGTPTETIVTIYKDYLQPIPIGLNDLKKNTVEMQVYPNPASNMISFATENLTAKDIAIYDITGKMIEKQNLSNGKLKMDVTNYNNGLYLYSVLSGNGETLKTGKITVNH